MLKVSRTAFAAVLLIASLNVFAEFPCSTEKAAAVAALRDAHLGQGLQQKLATKIENGWREFTSTQPNGRTNGENAVDQALRLLDSDATKQIDPAVVAVLHTALSNLAACMRSAPPIQTATLTVRAFIADPLTGLAGTSAGAGVVIDVNGEPYGSTAKNGTLTVTVPAGDLRVAASLGLEQYGTATTVLAVGATGSVDVVLQHSREVIQPSDIAATEIPDGVLNADFQTLTVGFYNDVNLVKIRALEAAEVRVAGNTTVNVTPAFTVLTSGAISLTNPAALRPIFVDELGPFDLKLTAFDVQGKLYINTIRFLVGRHTLSGVVTGPPSVGGLFVTALQPESGYAFHAVTDATGAFRWSNLPDGVYYLTCASGDRRYFGSARVAVQGDTAITLPLDAVESTTAGGLPATTLAVQSTDARVAAAPARGGVAFVSPVQSERSHFLEFEVTREGVFRPLLDQVLTFAHPSYGVSEQEFDEAHERNDHDVTIDKEVETIEVTVLDARRRTVFRTLVPVSMIGGGQEGFPRYFLSANSFAVRVPAANAKTLLLKHRLQSSPVEFDLDRLVTDDSLPLWEIAHPPGRPIVAESITTTATLSPANSNRVHVVILGDGYGDSTGFTSDANHLMHDVFGFVSGAANQFAGLPPYGNYGGYLLFATRFTPSAAISVTCSGSSTPAGSYYGTTYPCTTNSSGVTFISGLPSINESKAIAEAVNADPNYDKIIVLLNDKRGNGVTNFFSAVSIASNYTGAFDAGATLAAHEFTHNLAKVNDEYDQAIDPNEHPCTDKVFPPGCGPNVTDILDPSRVKWSHWFTPGADPLHPASGQIGMWLGADYDPTGHVRPEETCIMLAPYLPNQNTLASPNRLCHVCSDAYVLALYSGGHYQSSTRPNFGGVTTIDSYSPASTLVTVPVDATIPLTVNVPPVGISGAGGFLVTSWLANGAAVTPTNTNTTSSYGFHVPGPGTYSVQANVVDPATSFKISAPNMAHQVTWAITVPPLVTTATASVTSIASDWRTVTKDLLLPPGVDHVSLSYNTATGPTAACATCTNEWKVALSNADDPQGTTYDVKSGVVHSNDDDVSVSNFNEPIPNNPKPGPGLRLRLALSVRSNGNETDPTTLTGTVTFDYGTSPGPCTTNCAVTVAITNATVDPLPPDQTRGNSSFFSLPRIGALNKIQRTAHVTIQVQPPDAALRLKTDVYQSGGGALMTVNDGPLPNADAVALGNGQYQVTVTLKETPSVFASVPPPTNFVFYRFTVTASKNNVQDVATADVRYVNATDQTTGFTGFYALRGLWRMPDGLQRFDPINNHSVDDNWTSRGTYNWLQQNGASFPNLLFGAISGEHATNIGNSDHQYGSDFNIGWPYQFTDLPALTVILGDAQSQYIALRTAAYRLMTNAQQLGPFSSEFQQISQWNRLTRSALEKLAALPGVDVIVLGNGNVCGTSPAQGDGGLPANWLRDLLTVGKFIGFPGDFNPWTTQPSNLVFNCLYNDHVEVRLARCETGDLPGPCIRHRAVNPYALTASGTTTITAGQPAVLTATASGDNVTLQWFAGALGVSNTPVGQGGTVTVTPTVTTDYWVLATNDWGYAEQGGIVVTVLSPCVPPSITVQPQSTSVSTGGHTTLGVTAAGTAPLVIQWYTSDGTPAGSGPSITVSPAVPTTYHATVSNACGSVNSVDATVTIAGPCEPIVVTQQPPADEIIVVGQQAAFLAVSVTGTAPQFQWYSYDRLSGNSTPIAGANLSNYLTGQPGDYFCRISNDCSTVDSSISNVLAGAACVPAGIFSTTADQTITAGDSIFLSVVPSGSTPFTYGWVQLLADGTTVALPGGTGSSVSVTPTVDTTQYRVTVTNSCGTATSLPITITLCHPPVITQQPVAPLFTSPNQTATISVTATGSALHYTWFANAIAYGSDSPSITIAAPTNAIAYYCTISNDCGSVNTSVVIVYPPCLPPTITSQPQSQNVASGNSATLSVAASGTTPLSVSWFTSTGTAAGSGTSITVTPTATTSYYATVSNACGSVNSNTATVTLVASCVAPTITTQPQDVTITQGTTATLTVAATGEAPLQYQWYSTAGVPVGTSASVTVGPFLTETYYVVVSNGCGSVQSNFVTVTVNCIAPQITTAPPPSVTITAGQIIDLSVSATGTLLSYQWYQQLPTDALPQAIIGADLDVLSIGGNNAVSGTQYTCTVSNGCGSVTTSPTVLNVQ